jgi:two-component system chemotaxis sensor kinase CheA
MVSEIASDLGKEVDFVIEGEVYLNKDIVPKIQESLLHLIRNSIDHGLERSDVRRKMGKDPVGKITLASSEVQNQIQIIVSDDGSGLNPDKIVESAIKQRLITKAEADRLNPDEKLNLIFKPGFSTKDFSTDISGRGIGMDAVKECVDRIGGEIQIKNSPGHGVSFILSIESDSFEEKNSKVA